MLRGRVANVTTMLCSKNTMNGGGASQSMIPFQSAIASFLNEDLALMGAIGQRLHGDIGGPRRSKQRKHEPTDQPTMHKAFAMAGCCNSPNFGRSCAVEQRKGGAEEFTHSRQNRPLFANFKAIAGPRTNIDTRNTISAQYEDTKRLAPDYGGVSYMDTAGRRKSSINHVSDVPSYGVHNTHGDYRNGKATHAQGFPAMELGLYKCAYLRDRYFGVAFDTVKVEPNHVPISAEPPHRVRGQQALKHMQENLSSSKDEIVFPTIAMCAIIGIWSPLDDELVQRSTTRNVSLDTGSVPPYNRTTEAMVDIAITDPCRQRPDLST